mmetsp:Transcript_1276/g.2077  ORF Transcript_1276/g.2077 Transcript_1276/m.2077 type:complete len:256 (+) Transcript_1276:186-953(+)|eukprot:CAMPEP_0185017578 /NCGR_PEP_ID=MMETSP1103-20130426/512_1 /TAXON_ID=36769 /ORGANISM="Paraphysomonas bandaiensis, Strain Caron Lab Isolate" /LENGTH=255 /DNA_ID=CAMNT_0027547049 /DNA_START=157 /DNA_END=924 /DNA_ORIENTATION=+
MDTQESSTFLEDFVNSTELLPNDVRRNFELMRELDRDGSEALRQCEEAEKQYIRDINLKKITNPGEPSHEMENINSLREKAKQKIDEKVAIASQTLELVESFVRKMDTDNALFESLLRASGEFESIGAQKGQDVAAQPVVFGDWILGSVQSYSMDTGYYDIIDADDSKRYVLPESQVIILDLPESSKKLSKGESVLAVYPDTTAFYQAIVSQAPRRSAMGAEPSVTLQFVGDADETGQTPHRVVPLRHVVRPPQG